MISGRLLVASPAMADDNFNRTIVLVLEHNEGGAVGVVLNRASHTPLEHIVAPLAPLAAGRGVVHVGGPVAPSAAICLGRLRGPLPAEAPGEGASRLFGTIASVDLDAPVEALEAAVAEVRLFAGYAGWAGGQLEGEIAAGGWFVVSRTDDDVFCSDPAHLWRDVVRRQRRQSLAILSAYPEDISSN